jgi:hypothetical protein
MNRKRNPRRLLGKLLLVAVFLAAQITVVSHLDFDGHAQDTPCAICLSISTFGGANIAHPELTIAQGHSSLDTPFRPGFSASDFIRAQRARSPPVLS